MITGKSLIAGNWLADDAQPSFVAYSPLKNQDMSQSYAFVTEPMLEQAANAADDAFLTYSEVSASKRAEFLEAIAENILGLGDELIETTHLETGLPHVRLQGERMRTVNQLKTFANAIKNKPFDTIVDQADPSRDPLPKPGTRLEYLAVGPVAVFGASNFPYAFSVAGGDTASALAAGCPVIVKGHPAHPGTSELVAQAVDKAIKSCELPAGVFSMLQSRDRELSHTLVKHPVIKAVGFTGSLTVGQALVNSINQRQEAIPFYGELGSINPQIVLPERAKAGKELAETLVPSLLMGHGQFCTNPGLWVVPESAEELVQTAASLVEQQSSAPLLTKGIVSSYESMVKQRIGKEGVSLLAVGQTAQDWHVPAYLFKTDVTTFLANPELKEEIFGPFALVVTYQNLEELEHLVAGFEGQLTASILATDEDLQNSRSIQVRLKHKVGRLIYNQMPTGVEVCASMNHGGPFPSSTDVRATSVGTEAMKRFQRPICFQNRPEFLN